ncbi:MAG: replication initiation protein [Methylococcaceae bacterium]
MKNKKIPLPSLIVTQSNKLVEARYNLPLGEQRLILTMIAKIQPDDADFAEYRINVNEFASFLGIDKSNVYVEFHKIQKSIVSRVLVFYEEDGPLAIGWVSSAKYLEKEGAVLLSFDPKLKPYLLQLKGGFTSCKLEMLLSFKSQYSMRVYSLLKQYERLKVREIELELLRETLGLREDQHQDYKHFKSRILIPVQKELQSKADLYFEFDEIKYGRKVGAIRFRIFTKKTIKVVVDDVLQISPSVLSTSEISIASTVNSLLLLVPEQHQAKKTVQTAIAAYEKKYDFEYVKRNILYSNLKAEKSYAGFFNNALKEDWGHDWALEQKTKSERKSVTEIWARAGFKSEKEYNDQMYRKQMERYGQPMD